MSRSLALLLLCAFSLSGCSGRRYRVVEREDVYVDKQGRRVSDFFDPSHDHYLQR